MTTPAHDEKAATTTTTTKDLSELSFPEYEARRLKEAADKSAGTQSAPADESAEQKPSSKSDSEEKEAEESEKDEAEVESESEEEADESEDSEKDKPKKKKGGFQRRIDKLNARYSEERSRREALEQRLAQLESAGGNKKPDQGDSTKVEAEGKPKPEDFDTHAEYIDAVTDWKLEQRDKARQAEEQKSKLRSEQESLFKAHAERVKAFAETKEDWAEVLESVDDVPVSKTLQELIVSSENGPALLYELATNREELERISKLAPLAAAREMGKLEAKLAKASQAAEKPEPKKITSAPKPIEPVSGGKGAVAKSIYDPNLKFTDYERIRLKELQKKRA